jgi:stage II sporulation protein D
VLACALGASSARASSVLVVTGRGWGHGVGMSQWGAYGYARHGWSWQRILAHYYPGTTLGTVGEPRVRVLLAQDVPVVTVGCATPMSVSDATGMGHPLAAGVYGVGPKLVLPLRRVPVRASHRHGAPGVRFAGRRLRSPVVFQCPRAPLTVDGRAYHGAVVLRSSGGALSVVNSLPLDTYLRGVVGAEMPSHWSLAALEAQAVAARSYAIATLHPGATFDEFDDERSQAYGGIASEGPRTDEAVLATKGRILTWNGAVATAYYSASSGGETADVRDLVPGSGPVPYLRPVADPYDVASPHHAWGPIAIGDRRFAERLGLAGDVSSVRLERSGSGRVAAVDVGFASGAAARLTGEQVAQALHLRSTWFSVGRLSLAAGGARVLYGRSLRLVARADGVAGAVLQSRVGDGPWRTIRAVRAGTSVRVRPRAATTYRLAATGVGGPELAVAVAPRIAVRPLGGTLLGGSVLPRSDGEVTVWRRERGGWRLVARPRLDPRGVFRTRFRLRVGGYRVAVAGDARLAAAETRLHVTKRLLASLRRR